MNDNERLAIKASFWMMFTIVVAMAACNITETIVKSPRQPSVLIIRAEGFKADDVLTKKPL